MPPPLPGPRLPGARVVATVVAIAALGVVLRAPSFRVAILNEDEALYATAAADMAAGAPPYEAGVESKPPGIFYLYRAGFWLLGGRYRMRGLHGLTTVWVLLTAAAVAGVAARLAGERRGRTAAVAAVFYLVFTTVQEPAVLATQCELLFSLPLAVACLLLVRAPAGRALERRLWYGLAGVSMSAASLIKPTSVSLLLAALGSAAVVVVAGDERRPGARGEAIWRATSLVVGFCAGWGLTFVYFRHLGAWDDLVYWAFRWTWSTYLPTGFGQLPFVRRFCLAFGAWGALSAVLWILAGRGLFHRWIRGRRGPPPAPGDEPGRGRSAATAPGADSGLVALWAAAAAGMVCLGGRFFDHYFPALVTPLAILAALGTADLPGDAPGWSRRLVLAGTAAPALLCLVAATRFETAMRWLGDARKPYAGVAAYIGARTRPADRIFVWGYFPLIYVAADRLSATRFVGCHYLTGYAAIGLGRVLPRAVEDRLQVPGGFEQLLRDLEQNRAELFIDTAPANLHGWSNYPVSRYPRLAEYLGAHFSPEAVVDGAVVYRRRTTVAARGLPDSGTGGRSAGATRGIHGEGGPDPVSFVLQPEARVREVPGHEVEPALRALAKVGRPEGLRSIGDGLGGP
jgi:hypothetical protein